MAAPKWTKFDPDAELRRLEAEEAEEARREKLARDSRKEREADDAVLAALRSAADALESQAAVRAMRAKVGIGGRRRARAAVSDAADPAATTKTTTTTTTTSPAPALASAGDETRLKTAAELTRRVLQEMTEAQLVVGQARAWAESAAVTELESLDVSCDRAASALTASLRAQADLPRIWAAMREDDGAAGAEAAHGSVTPKEASASSASSDSALSLAPAWIRDSAALLRRWVRSLRLTASGLALCAHRYSETARFARDALLEDADDAPFWVLRGRAFASMGCLLLAELHFDRVLQLRKQPNPEFIVVDAPLLDDHTQGWKGDEDATTMETITPATTDPAPTAGADRPSPPTRGKDARSIVSTFAMARTPWVGPKDTPLEELEEWKRCLVRALNSTIAMEEDDWVRWRVAELRASRRTTSAHSAARAAEELRRAGNALFQEGFAFSAGVQYRSALELHEPPSDPPSSSSSSSSSSSVSSSSSSSATVSSTSTSSTRIVTGADSDSSSSVFLPLHCRLNYAACLLQRRLPLLLASCVRACESIVDDLAVNWTTMRSENSVFAECDAAHVFLLHVKASTRLAESLIEQGKYDEALRVLRDTTPAGAREKLAGLTKKSPALDASREADGRGEGAGGAAAAAAGAVHPSASEDPLTDHRARDHSQEIHWAPWLQRRKRLVDRATFLRASLQPSASPGSR